ncbi:MAG TPA: OstA-like protein [Chitinophagales bacterium]|nr:OstA-like protein [Chitinophagales bacterium]
MKDLVLCLLLLIIAPIISTAQTDTTSSDKKEVEIINADYLKMQEVDGKKYTRLVGNVALKQDGVLMYCDSAIMDKETNSVDAYGRVHIQQDTINAYSQTLHHDGNAKFSRLTGNCKLTDGQMRLYTDELFYDVKNKMSYYLVGGRVLKDSTVITSQRGYYYSNTREVFFNGDVKMRDPNYNLNSDTLKYHVETKISTFFGNTVLFNESSTIYCNSGWYNSNRNVSAFGKNTVVINPPQRIDADSLYYERNRGYGKAVGYFTWVDSSMDVEIRGHLGEFIDSQQYIMATQKPLLIYKMDKDSLFLIADTLKSMQHSASDTSKNFFAYHHVRMYMKQMQAVSDSMFYSFSDSTFRMFYQPVIWSDGIQMSGDTIYLKTKNKKADLLSIYKAGFIISPSGDKYYDQIKGINIFGYFVDNELHHMDVKGNGESLYFGKDEKNKYIGNNKALSTDITLYFRDKKIDKIVFIEKPEAVFTPLKMLTAELFKLKDFNWQIDRKPKSREELLNR